MGLPWENMDAIPCGKTWHAIDHALLIDHVVILAQNDFIRKKNWDEIMCKRKFFDMSNDPH